MLELNQCYNMDCMKGMAQFPDGFFDLAVVDPPYFSGPERRGYYGSKVSKIGVYRDYPVSPAWEIPGRAYFDELRRVSKHYIVWGCNYFNYEFAPGRIVWDKCKKGTSFSDCELAATDIFNTVRLFRFMWNGMLQGKSIAEGHIMQGNKKLNEQRIHPTQKPVALYDWIFQNYAAPGCRVLDTHLGSGSSRIAAYEAGVDFIGFEIDPIYYAAEEQRFFGLHQPNKPVPSNINTGGQDNGKYQYFGCTPDVPARRVPGVCAGRQGFLGGHRHRASGAAERREQPGQHRAPSRTTPRGQARQPRGADVWCP